VLRVRRDTGTGVWPSTTMSPDVGRARPVTMRPKVDLPLPEAPTSATISRGARRKETSLIATSAERPVNGLVP